MTAHVDVVPTRDELVDRARRLVPRLRDRARRTEELRRLPDETFADLMEAGFFKLFQPARYRGYEMDWGIQVDVGREVGRGCGSSAWIVSVVGSHAAILGRFADEAQRDVWHDDPDVLIATGSARTEGEAKPVDGGFLLRGTWRFASGVDFAPWSIAAAPLLIAGQPFDHRNLVQCLVPRSDYRIVDDWHVSGLRGTGSKNIVIDEEVFVPEHRTLKFADFLGARPPGAATSDSYVYDVEFAVYFGTSLLGPILGAAYGALEEYTESTRSRVGAIFRDKVADALPVQLRLARSAAEIDAAALVAQRILDVLHRRGTAGETLTPQERVESMRDRAFLTRTCVDAVHRLVRQMGASGLSDANAVQRHFRDISAMATQIGVAWDRNLGPYGKWALGMPTGIPAIDDEPSAQPAGPGDIE